MGKLFTELSSEVQVTVSYFGVVFISMITLFARSLSCKALSLFFLLDLFRGGCKHRIHIQELNFFFQLEDVQDILVALCDYRFWGCFCWWFLWYLGLGFFFCEQTLSVFGKDVDLDLTLFVFDFWFGLEISRSVSLQSSLWVAVTLKFTFLHLVCLSLLKNQTVAF